MRKQRFLDMDADKRQEAIDAQHDRANLELGPNFYELMERETDEKMREAYRMTLEIAKAVEAAGGKVLVIGGFVRDTVLNQFGHQVKSKDVDVEVYGLTLDRLREVLAPFGNTDVKGESFGVLKFGDVDVALSRRETKNAPGHKGFKIELDEELTILEAARRRDFTVGAMAMDPFTGQIIDKYGGIEDARQGLLRVVDPSKFVEDPLRVLRAAQFVGRFNFTIEENTANLCRELVYAGKLKELARERFEEEWKKLLLKSKKPSLGLEAARDLGIIEVEYPALRDLIGCKQEYDWHPEGDVWTHTLLVVDEAVKIAKRENLSEDDTLILVFAALAHDFGKPSTTKYEEKKGRMRYTSNKHEEMGVEPARQFFKSIHLADKYVSRILPLIQRHLIPTKYQPTKYSDAAIKKLVKNMAPASLKQLVLLGEADAHGRGYWDDQPNHTPDAKPWDHYPSGAALLEHAKRFKDISVEGGKPFRRYLEFQTLQDLGIDQKHILGARRGLMVAQLTEAQLQEKITGPEDLRLAKLMVFLANSEFDGRQADQELLNGEIMTKGEMREFLQHRFWNEGLHDMGTLVMYHLLAGNPLPEALERNKAAILTAHKHGPAWFSRFDREFYEGPWKSFYGKFEESSQGKEEEKQKDFIEQARDGIALIEHPDQGLIAEYNQSLEVKPVTHEGKVALYVTNSYPFEAGLMDGYQVMVQFSPEKRRVCVSVMDTDPAKVTELDGKIRTLLPEFSQSKKTGYLFAQDAEGSDNTFTQADAERVYKQVVESGLAR